MVFLLNITQELLDDPQFPTNYATAKRNIHFDKSTKRDIPTNTYEHNGPLAFDPEDVLGTSRAPYTKRVNDPGIRRKIVKQGREFYSSEEREEARRTLKRDFNATAFFEVYAAELYAVSWMQHVVMRQQLLSQNVWLNWISYEDARGFIRDVSTAIYYAFGTLSLDIFDGQCGFAVSSVDRSITESLRRSRKQEVETS